MKLEISRVPNEYRCADCNYRMSAQAGERPVCPTCGPSGRLSAVDWKAIAAERLDAYRALQEQLEKKLLYAQRIGSFFAFLTFAELLWIMLHGR